MPPKRSRRAASPLTRYARSQDIGQMVRILDDIAYGFRDKRSKRYRDLAAFLKKCPDSIHNGGYPPGYKGPSKVEIATVLARY